MTVYGVLLVLFRLDPFAGMTITEFLSKFGGHAGRFVCMIAIRSVVPME